MKKKQLKKRMKAKKRLTSAAVALLMSGSLLPVGNVFANEQSTQESSISSAEAKADLEKGMAVSGVENSTEAKQETQNTEKTSENSEDDKISIPETARDSKEATKSSTQDTSSELPEGLRNVKSTRLSDGRISVDISTPDQLQEAFNTSLVGQVNLANDMVLNKNINMYSSKNSSLIINGNNHSINLNYNSFWGDDGDKNINVKMSNLVMINGGGWGAFDSPGASLEVENVKYTGTSVFIQANKIKLSGNIDIEANQNARAGNSGVISSYWNSADSHMIISENANVKIKNSAPNGTEILCINNLLVKSGAKVTLESPINLPNGIIYGMSPQGNISIDSNAELNIKSSVVNTRGINNNFNAINVSKNGCLNVSTNSDYAVVINNSNATINLSGAKFNIQTTKSNGLPLYMGNGGTVSFDKQNVRAWLKGFATATDPQYSWDNVTGVVNMSGANTTSALSNNTEFNALFKNQNFSRISSNGRATQELTKTTINEVKDTDTTVSGKGEPNGKIELKVGDQVIASGTVGSDGNYSLTIPKQNAGTVIKAVVSMDGQTSEANTTVVRTALSQTTISEINTETTQVSGKGEPNAPIKIMNGDQIIAQGVVGSDGNYTLTIPRQAKDSVIKAIVEKDGLTSEAQTTVKQGSLAQTTISEINTETTQVSGKGEPNAPIKIMNGDQIIAQGVIGSDGNYTLTIPKQAKDSVIKAIVEKDGLTSKAQTTVTQGSLVQTTISNIDTNTTSVSGKGEPNAKIELKVGNQVIASGRIGSDGNYSLTIPKQSVGTVVKAVVSANGLTSEAHTTVTRADLAPTTISKVDSQTTVITGTGEPGGKIELLNGNQLIAQGYVGKDGHYSLTVMKQPAGSTIVAKVTMDGKESQASTVVEEKINLQAPVIDKFTEGDVYAKGNIAGDAKKVAIFVNGVQRRVAAVSNGKYSIYAGDLGLKAGDKFEIAGIAADGTIGPKTSATVQKNPVLELTTTIDKFTEGDAYAKGTVGKDATKVAIFVNGVQRRVAAVSNGKYSIYAGDLGLKAGDKFEIAGIAGNGTIGPKTSAIVQKKVVLELTTTIDKFTEGDAYAKGTVGKDATKVAIFVNGVQRRVAAVSNGKYSIYAGDLGLKAGDKFEIAGIAGNGTIGPKTSATVQGKQQNL
ncbi:TPA: Ig-like domain-containing protein, partial [Enterococcus faecium]